MWEGSVERNCEPLNKKRIEGVAEQGERAINREALVIKAKRRRSGGCAGKECVLTQWDGRPHSTASNVPKWKCRTTT